MAGTLSRLSAPSPVKGERQGGRESEREMEEREGERMREQVRGRDGREGES